MRKERGITIIALTITIVIMMILVGIAVTAVIKSGLLSSTKEARREYDKGKLSDEVAAVVSDQKIGKYTGGSTTFKQKLESGISGTKTIEDVPGVSDTYYVTRDGVTVTVYENGTVEKGRIEVWEGTSGTNNGVECPEFKNEESVWNWYIYTPEQLKFLADFVNNGNSLTGDVNLTSLVTGYNTSDITMGSSTKVYLMNDLDMGARPGTGATVEAKWETAENESKNWTPIGKTKALRFVGTFEGQGHTIRGLYVNLDANFGGIFGNANIIKDLTIKESYVKGGSATGGIAGSLRDTGRIENCHNINTTIILREGNSYCYAGGVLGQTDRDVQGGIFNCTNSGDIYGYGIYVVSNSTDYPQCIGGVVGLAFCDVSQCKNTGTVRATGSRAGGVMGQIGETTVGAIVSKCENRGEVISDSMRVGGVCGVAAERANLSECINYGSLTGGESIGGVVGHFAGSNMEKCVNMGTVKQIGGNGELGGLIGCIAIHATPNVRNCYNTGRVIEEASNTDKVGGLIGSIYNKLNSGAVSNNYNRGMIEITGSNVTVGGVIGAYTGTAVTLNYNYYQSGCSTSQLNDFGEAVTAANMKKTAFVNNLNTNQSPTVWVIKPSQNDGYPVFK